VISFIKGSVHNKAENTKPAGVMKLYDVVSNCLIIITHYPTFTSVVAYHVFEASSPHHAKLIILNNKSTI